jgi:ribosomal protein S18 acetylase RimI-like enzyme
MITIKSLKQNSFGKIYEAFHEAFIDYEMQVNKEELQTMIMRRGFVPELSFAAFEGEKIIAFTLNGVGNFNGIKTAYDTGTGTLKEYRGQGLASEVFTFSIPFLKDAGVKQYLLEVLQHNEAAVSVYRKQGFEVSREFHYFMQEMEKVQAADNKADHEYQIESIDGMLHPAMLSFCDFPPSWQNSFEAVARKPEDYVILGAYEEQRLIGYCIFEPISGDLTQIAVDKDYRRQGIASSLLDEALKYNMHSNVKCINTDINCNNIASFLESRNIGWQGKQFEMTKKL